MTLLTQIPCSSYLSLSVHFTQPAAGIVSPIHYKILLAKIAFYWYPMWLIDRCWRPPGCCQSPRTSLALLLHSRFRAAQCELRAVCFVGICGKLKKYSPLLANCGTAPPFIFGAQALHNTHQRCISAMFYAHYVRMALV